MPLRSRAKLATETRGASVVLDASPGGQGAESVRVFLQRVRANRSVITLLLVLMLAYSQRHWVVAWVDHPIDNIAVQGQLRYASNTAIQQSLDGWLQGSFMLTDLQEIKVAAEAHPWVDNARVTRLWPGALRIDVSEQEPSVIWNDTGYLNPRGEIFQPQDSIVVPGLIQLRAPADASLAARQSMLSTLSALQQDLAVQGFGLTAAMQDARGTWRIRLVQGPEVALGSAPFDDKLERLAEVWAFTPADARSRIEAIDTRYPNGVAVRWQEIQVADSRDVGRK